MRQELERGDDRPRSPSGGGSGSPAPSSAAPSSSPAASRDFPSLKEVGDALPSVSPRGPPRNNTRWRRDDDHGAPRDGAPRGGGRPSSSPTEERSSPHSGSGGSSSGGYDRSHHGGGRDFDRYASGGSRSPGGGYDREERGDRGYYDRGDRGYHDRGYGRGGARGRWEREEPNPFENQPEETGVLNFDSYDEIPVETSGKECPEPVQTFTEMGLAGRLHVNIELARYSRPTPVQKYAIPVALASRDLMGCAQTGSGKTAAFLFPIISQLIERPADYRPPDERRLSRSKAYPACLVLAPTRELATQIYEESRKFCYKTGIRPVVCYGGAPISQQLREIEQGCHILVATPGRLVDILERGRASLANIQHLVLDEADRMLDMGFEPQIRRIVNGEDMPPTGRRRTYMFSATFPKEIQTLAGEFLEDYIFLRVGRVGSTTDLVTQHFIYVNDEDKRDMLVDLLTSVEGLTLIFVETKRAADSLEHFLCNQGFPAISIHGDRTQAEREMALAAFKAGERPFLIATNVASRGLDIRGVIHVMNYDMPNDIDEYVHRIGRTGRAGATGRATSFVNEANKGIARDLVELLAETKQEIPQWLDAMMGYGGRSSGHRGGRGGSSRDGRFGGRDYRQSPGFQNRRSDSGSRSSYSSPRYPASDSWN